MGIFSRRTNRTQEARVYSHDGSIGHSERGYILTTDQSDTVSAGIFSQRTNRTREVLPRLRSKSASYSKTRSNVLSK
eukprot:1184868-Prorocentrum_minimum.AAC.2